jgi:tRNA dimethylallyltransferase
MKGKRLIVMVGPTAVGKTGLAIRLARQLHTEIISADSRQVFRELVIGTARPSPEELAQVPHHFVGIKSIQEEYGAGQYGRDALAVIDQLFKKYDNVILCGGSGLYIKAVCEGLDELPAVPTGVRETIMAEYKEKGLAWLQKQVEENDPDYFMTVDQRNPHRLVRALELNYASGKPMGELRQGKKQDRPFAIVKIGLDLDRVELYTRIDQRMDTLIEAGLFEEAEGLYPLKSLNALQTVGYQEIFGFLDGNYDKEEAIRQLKRNSRRYAKRQLTWFRKDKDVRWFKPDQVQEIVTFALTSLPDEQ